MTREEIVRAWKDFDAASRKRYWEAGCSVDASLDAPLAFAAWVRQATLGDAARAGCWYCKNGNVATFETDDAAHGGWFHHFDDETQPDRCRSAAIHDLIAALDKEAHDA